MMYPESVIINNDDGDGSGGKETKTTLPNNQHDEQELSQSFRRHELSENQQDVIEGCDMITGALILDGDENDHDHDGDDLFDHNGDGVGSGSGSGSSTSNRQYMMNMNIPQTDNGNNPSINNYNVILRSIETTPDFDYENHEEDDDLNTIPPSVNMDMTTTTIDEMIELFDEMKHRNSNFKVFLFCISLFFIIITSHLSHQLYEMQRRNEKLVTDLERLENEKLELLMMKDRLLEGQSGVALQESAFDETMSMFEINNCYLNIRTEVALGQCTKKLYDKFNNWYFSDHKDRQCFSEIWSDPEA